MISPIDRKVVVRDQVAKARGSRAAGSGELRSGMFWQLLHSLPDDLKVEENRIKHHFIGRESRDRL